MEEKDFKLKDIISEGGTGELYSAVLKEKDDQKEELLYAVKVIAKGKFDDFVKKERQITQRIENFCNYSIVIPILKVEQDRENYYMLMQFKRNGQFLDAVLDDIKTSNHGVVLFKHILGLILTILDSLGKLHHCLDDIETGQGYLHLDLHPGNIFLESINWRQADYGVAKFIDLQMAQELDKTGKCIEPGNVLGITESFSAPELYSKRKDALTESTDLYSVARLFLYLMSGTKATTVWTEYEDYFEEESDLCKKLQIAPPVYTPLKQMLKCGISYNPEYRFHTAKEMRDVLQSLEKMQRQYEECSYYALFQTAYQMGMRIDDLRLEETQFVPRAYLKAVKSLEARLLSDNIAAHESYFIFVALSIMAERNKEKIHSELYMDLLNCGLACCNHLSYTEEAIRIYDKMRVLKKDTPILQWVGIANRIAVVYADSFQNRKALEIIWNNISNLERVKEAFLQIAESEKMEAGSATRLPALARAYSAYGSYLAFEKNSDALIYFEKAIEEFGEDRANQAITRSHIMHYALAIKDEELFEKCFFETYRKSFSETEGIKEFIEAEESAKNYFDLWIYLKAIYVFKRELEVKGVKEKLLELVAYEPFYNKKQHPEALILKYCALLLFRLNENQMDDSIRRIFRKAIQQLETQAGKKETGTLNLTKITAYHIQSIFMVCCGADEEAKELYNQFIQRLETEGIAELKNWLVEINKERTVPRIDLKYEYC